MKAYICVDDTDDLTKSTSTGKIADLIRQEMVNMGGTEELGITRHQLLLHEDIEYTSHNSSMCMVINIEGKTIEEMKTAAEKILKENMAESSDPGLCFCRLDQLKEPDLLIAYGKRAQKEVIRKQEAYDLAEKIGGTVLQEYGGTGIGVIGALAGVGLRLAGCDGTFRGGKGGEFSGQTHSAAEWKSLLGIQQIITFDGKYLDDEDTVCCKDQMKLSMADGKKTLVVKEQDGQYFTCKKKDLYQGDRQINSRLTSCDLFEQDNDIEECYDELERGCYNCLFRRWTADGFRCTKQEA